MTNAADYPTRNFSLVTPSVAETKLTGWVATARFERQGHRYDIRFVDNRMQRLSVECMRDGKPVSWDKLTNAARKIAHKAADFLRSAAEVRSAA